MFDLHACRREPCLEQRQTCRLTLHSSWRGSTGKSRRALRAKVGVHVDSDPATCLIEPHKADFDDNCCRQALVAQLWHQLSPPRHSQHGR